MLVLQTVYGAQDFLSGDRVPEDVAWTDHPHGEPGGIAVIR